MTEKTACLVMCGGQKRDGKNPSWAVYDSTLFEKSWAAASLLGDPYVMSAKHHLLTVDDRVRKYDMTLKNVTDEEKSQWGKTVKEQLPEHYSRVVLFGSRDYVEPLKNVLETDIVDVYEDCRGNGEMMGVASDIIETEMNGEPYL